MPTETGLQSRKISNHKPLPFANRVEVTIETNSGLQGSLFEHLEKKHVDHLGQLCSQPKSNRTPSAFLLAAIQSFISRYSEDEEISIVMIDACSSKFVSWKSSCELTFDELLDITDVEALQAVSWDKEAVSNGQNSTVKHGGTGNTLPSPHLILVDKRGDENRSNPTHDNKSDNLSSHQLDPRDATTLLGLQFSIFRSSMGGWKLDLRYDMNLYTKDSMVRFLDNFIVFLSSVIQDPSQLINTIPMCGTKEITFLEQSYWNTPFTPNPWEDMTICQKITDQSRHHPHSIAVIDSSGTSISYSQLIESARGVATFLRKIGVTSGRTVCVLMQPTVELVIAVLGILMARGCYVGLESDFASERLSFIVSDCCAYAILHDEETSPLVKEKILRSKENLHTVPYSEAILASDDGRILQPVPQDDPMYMVYTSGSSGKPKGIKISHANAHQMLASLSELLQFSFNDRFLQQTSLCFDLSVVQIFSALSAGAQVCVATRDLRKDPSQLAEFMAQQSISVTYFTPTHFALLLEYGSEALRRCLCYRLALFAGETLPVRVVKAFYDICAPATVYNAWGPSEPVVQTAICKVDYLANESFNIPLGRPLPNCRHYITDSVLNPLPVGLIGEICVGGPQVGMGYLNRPEENSRSFINDTFCSRDDLTRGWNRLFRSGDKGRFLSNGMLEFHGRIVGDQQIKLRGFRLDLREIEKVLYQQSLDIDDRSIIGIVVMAKEKEGESNRSSMTDNRQLIAFIVTKIPIRNAIDQILYAGRLHLSAKPYLNEYMLPNSYQFLDRFPTTVGGKIDRQRLNCMQLNLVSPSSGVRISEAGIAPINSQSKTLSTVLDIMDSILKPGRQINPEDDFFDLGGQSVQLLRLQRKLSKRFSVTLPLRDMFQTSSPAGLSNMIEVWKDRNDAKSVTTYTSGTSISWPDEIALPNEPRYLDVSDRPLVKRGHEARVLLTGVDTYPGIHMLSQLLLVEPPLDIYVIGQSRHVTMREVVSDLEKYQLLNRSPDCDNTEIPSRLRCISGSMSSFRFGLSRHAFEDLASTIDIIYNFAADVSLMRPYSDLARINTKAVLTLIDLACSNPSVVPEIHHLSTWSVPHIQTWASTIRTMAHINAREESPAHFTPPTNHEHGYLKSRWAAEMLLTEAAKRGIPVSIYRSSAIIGSFKAGAPPAPSNDFISKLVNRCIRHNAVPHIDSSRGDTGPDFVIDSVPIDILTTAILHLATENTLYKPEELKIYHLGSSRPLSLHDLLPLMSTIRHDSGVTAKKPAEYLAIEDWTSVVDDESKEDEQLFWVVFKEYMKQGHRMFALDRKRSEAALAKLSKPIVFPQIDEEYLAKWWRKIE